MKVPYLDLKVTNKNHSKMLLNILATELQSQIQGKV